MRKNLFVFFMAISFLIAVSLFGADVHAASGASYITHAQPSSFNTYYGGRVSTYWPVLDNPSECTAREDILLQIAPAGCQPAVVRSDLLAEQNVPVFCQVDALQINPLIDVKEIRGISFPGQERPKEVAAVGFHPARAALRTRDRLLGDPIINNIGYVVVVLRKQSVESELPEFVNVNLTARLDYASGNALGIGRAEFILTEVSDKEWKNNEKIKQSFWNGRYSVRLDDADANSAKVSIYAGDHKVSSTSVVKGERSARLFVPGSYCGASLQVEYAGFNKTEKSVRLELSTSEGTDVIDVYKDSRFLNGQCRVTDIQVGDVLGSGNISLRCPSGKLLLNLDKVSAKFDVLVNQNGIRAIPEFEIGRHVVTLDGLKFGIDANDDFVVFESDKWKIVSVGTTERSKENLIDIEKALREYKRLYPEGARDILLDRSWDEIKGVEENYLDAIEAFEDVARDYPEAEKNLGGKKIGAESLENAINLAHDLGKVSDEVRLKSLYVEVYSETDKAKQYEEEIKRSNYLDYSSSVGVVEANNRFVSVRLAEVREPRVQPSAEFSIDSRTARVALGEAYYSKDLQNEELFNVVNVDAENVVINSNCEDNVGSRRLKLKDAVTLCGRTVVFQDADIEEVARIRLIPESYRTRGETSLNVNIGIEKRAIDLTPDKALERIEELNKSIAEWEKLNKNLGNVVSGLKGACFATATVLTAKNFVTGLSGAGFARQQVMQGDDGWTERCRALVEDKENKQYKSLDACFNDNAKEIAEDVRLADSKIREVNAVIKDVESNHDRTVGVFGKSVNTEAAASEYRGKIVDEFGDDEVIVNGKPVKVEDLLSNDDGYKEAEYSYSQLRDLHFNLLRQKEGSDFAVEAAKSELDTIGGLIQANQDGNRIRTREDARVGTADSFPVSSSGQKPRYVDIVDKANYISDKKQVFENEEVTHVASTVANQNSNFESGRSYEGGNYILGLAENGDGSYRVLEVKRNDGDVDKANYVSTDSNRELNAGEFADTFGIGTLHSRTSLNYNNKYTNPQIHFHETEPNKGMPAIVPIDVKNGWYAATKQTLPAFGGIQGFDASGRVRSFELCNVGENNRNQFFEGRGDDICQQINLNTGQPIGVFHGLSEGEAKSLVARAISAIDDVARQSGQKRVRYKGVSGDLDLGVGKPALNLPSVECQNFMSPGECNLIFNVCDPVICPTSRCNFGGAYPVTDVVQSGIIGSTLLCLPNFPEVKVPVCLSGIHAGVEGYVSILQSHRDCLQESVDSGQLVGVCDQLYSIYTCEFFWRQLAPLAKVLVPKLLEGAYGQNVRGGGEYLTVMGAWQNTQKSVNYFTNIYGVNALKAFKARSVEEVGGDFCKAFVSAKAPSSIETVLAPDSPPQFHAYFSQQKFSDATVPATAQYKVFYHIFAGKDAGVFYRVYLKNPPDVSYYSANPTLQVASGFAPKGDFRTETRDFTAPEGYQELCVLINGEEECGFKQVSTSFAVNYVKDQVVAGEIDNVGISSERECISGSVSAAALLNPSADAAAQEALSPDLYRRGVVRICASRNPGSSTDPTRFVPVGYCDDQKVQCWLDQESVDRAITDNNLGVRDETLEDLEELQKANFDNDQTLFKDDAANAELNTISEFVSELEHDLDNVEPGLSAKDKDKTDSVLKRIDDIRNGLYLNHHKASLSSLKGRVHAYIANRLTLKIRTEESSVEGRKATSGNEENNDPGNELDVGSDENLDTVREVLESSIAFSDENLIEVSRITFTYDLNQGNDIWGFDKSLDLKYTTLGSWVVSKRYSAFSVEDMNEIESVLKGKDFSEGLLLLDGMIRNTDSGSLETSSVFYSSAGENDFYQVERGSRQKNFRYFVDEWQTFHEFEWVSVSFLSKEDEVDPLYSALISSLSKSSKGDGMVLIYSSTNRRLFNSLSDQIGEEKVGNSDDFEFDTSVRAGNNDEVPSEDVIVTKAKEDSIK